MATRSSVTCHQAGTNVVVKEPGVHVTGSRKIVVASIHKSNYPSQVVVLDGKGARLGEYWHSGHLGHLDALDLDGDGEEEILAGGVNNGYGAATLVVLDARRVAGASRQPENDHRKLKGFAPGTERARIVFPRTCINRKLHDYNRIHRLTVERGLIRVEVLEHGDVEPRFVTIYFLNRELQVAEFDYTDRTKSLHREMESRGELNHPLTEQEIVAMRQVRRIQ